MKSLMLMACALLVLLMSSSAGAQVLNNNFFDRQGVALYNPVVDVVNSGARLVAAPTVSADLKYVTIAAQPQVSQLIALQTFPVATGVFGTVGGPVRPAGGSGANANAPARAVVRPAAPGNILGQTGMIRIEGP